MIPQMIEAVETWVMIFCFVLFPVSAAMSYFSRKVGADLQARVGPNRAGPAGVLQPWADLLKSLQKEEAANATPIFQQVSLAIQFAFLLSTVTILPLSSSLLLLDTDMSAFLALWAALGVAMLTLMVGFRQASVPAWISAIRVAGQAVAGTFPALITILFVGVRAGSFRWSKILAAQNANPFSWTFFSSPFAPFAFLIFVISGLVLFSSPPMESASARPETAGGVSSLWAGRNLSLADFGKFYGFFLWSCMAVALFLGGWVIPQGVQEALSGNRLQTILEAATLLIKSFALMILITAIAKSYPRTRTDQITGLLWRVLSPLALICLAGESIWKACLS